MDKNVHQSAYIRRGTVLLLVLTLLVQLCPTFVFADSGDDMMIGTAPYESQGGCLITQVNEPVYEGDTSLYVTGRTDIWHGAKWNAKDTVTEPGVYCFIAYVRADAESDGQRLSYLLNAGGNYFTFAEVTLSAEHWMRMYGVARLEQAQIDAVRQNGYADVYPLSSGTGNYYIDSVSLSLLPEDDMSICGAEPYAQGGSISRAYSVVYVGNDSLLAEGRTESYHGAAWSVPASSLGTLADKDFWTLHMQVRAASGNMTLGYNLEFWYNDGTPNKYLNASAVLTDSEWTALTGTWAMEDGYITDALDRVVIYPVSGPGELGSYYIDDVSLTGSYVPDDMTLCGVEPHAQGGSIRRVTDPVYTGRDSLLSEGREAFYNGAAWTIPTSSLGELKEKTVWTLQMQARSALGGMTLGYNLEFWYNDGTPNKYLNASAVLTDSEWTALTGTWAMEDGYITDALDRVVIYPVSGPGELGSYYIDDVSLTGSYVPDDMTLCGVEPHAQGGSIRRVTDPVYTGRDSLLSEGREAFYNGAAWEIPAEKLGSLRTNTTWTLSLFARSASGTMKLAYNIELWYSDNVADCRYYSASAEIGTEWTELKGRFEMPESDMDGLKRVVIYPATGETQLGDYYIDAPTLTGAPTVQHDDMTIGGKNYFVHGSGTLERTTEAVYAGEDSLLVKDRTQPYSGAGYDVCAYLKKYGWGNWFVSAYAMAVDEPMSLSYSIYLRFEDGTEDWLSPGTSYYITSAGWKRINTDFCGGDKLLKGSRKSYDFSKLEAAVLYPCTGEGQLGAYYLDEIKLYRGSDDYTEPVIPFTSFPLDGDFEKELDFGAPGCLFVHGEGALLERVEEDGGNHCLRVSNRISSYSGAGWVVTDYLKQEGWGDWYCTARAKSIDGEYLALSYSIYMQFDDGTEGWLTSGVMTFLSNKIWQTINLDTAGNPAVLKPMDGSVSLDFSKLTYAVLYPGTSPDGGPNENLYSDYYLDDVRLWREDPKGTEVPEETVPPAVKPQQTPAEAERPLWPWIVGGAGAAAIAVGVILLITRKKHRRTK